MEFNTESFLSQRCRVTLAVDWEQPGEVRLTLPELNPTQNLAAPAHTETILFRFAIGGCAVEKGEALKKQVAEIRIPYEHALLPAQTISIPFSADSDTLALVAMDMKYEKVNKKASKETGTIWRNARTDKRWTPCGIVASHYYP